MPIKTPVLKTVEPTVKKDLGGRPTKYNLPLADKICQEVAKGISLRTICKADDMPDISSIFEWFRVQPGFSSQYEKAKEESAKAMAEDIMDIADEGKNDWMEKNDPGNPGYKAMGENIQRSRLRVDTRKWLMSKMAPKKWGEKLDVTSDGKALPTPIYGSISIKNGDDKDV